MKFKYITIFILVIMIIAFVTCNMHVTNLYVPFLKPVEIHVISLFLIGFLLGSTIWFVLIIQDQHNNKKKSKKVMKQY